MLLDHGQDSLLARVHLIRSARRTIDLQTFHFEGDDSGRVVLDELRAAAQRGVKVRLLMDQLNSLADPQLQAGLASFHVNFELRLYNPVFSQAQISPFEYLGAIFFSFKDLNQRMHNKVMLVDERVAIIGGRNIQDEYFDWNDQYNYRDRDLLVAGPATLGMKRNFDAFWNDHRALPPVELDDVAQVLLKNRGPPESTQPPRSARVEAMDAAAGDGAAVFAQLSQHLFQVGRVDFFGDLPSKHDEGAQSRVDASEALRSALAGSKRELLLQTPYLVMTQQARELFRTLHRREQPLQRSGFHQFAGRHRRLSRVRDVAQVQAALPARARLPDLRVQTVPGQRADRPGQRARRQRDAGRDPGLRACDRIRLGFEPWAGAAEARRRAHRPAFEVDGGR